MNDDNCFDCKYHGTANHRSFCAWYNGLRANFDKCPYYERDWSKTISFYLFMIMFFGMILFVIIGFIGILFGWW